MTKKEIRKLYLEKRKSLSPRTLYEKSQRIKTLFFEQVFSASHRHIHLFLPIKKHNEIDTWLIVDELKARHAQVRIVISRSIPEKSQMINYYFDPETRLVENKWGIPEPDSGVVCDTMKIDLVLIPALAIDQQGHRVGYGKGFYDRFLVACRRDALKVGLTLDPPIAEIEDISDFDVKLDLAVTPEQIYKF